MDIDINNVAIDLELVSSNDSSVHINGTDVY